MKVKELKEILQELDQEKEIMVYDYGICEREINAVKYDNGENVYLIE